MPEQNTLLTIFIGVLAFAVLLQALLFFGIFRSIRQIKTWMDAAGKDLLRDIADCSAKIDEGLAVIKGVGEGMKSITTRLSDATEIVHRRVVDLDAFFAEATNTARLEILRVQDTIQSAVKRADDVLEQLQGSILAPINEVSAISRAIRAGFDVLFRRRRHFSDRSAQDEEMFI